MPNSTVQCPVSRTAESDPERPAIVTPGRSFTYSQFDRLIDNSASRLRTMGVGSGTRVAALLQNDWQDCVLVWALLRIGGILVPLNPREPASRLREQAQLAGCEICICATPGAGVCGIEQPWESVLTDAGVVPIGLTELSLSAPATILFTSGSSGVAKGALLTMGNHWFSAAGSQSIIPIDSRSKWMVALPLHHVGGLSILFRSFLHGGCVVIGKGLSIPVALRELNPSHISLVPTQLVRLLDAGESECLTPLRCVLVGGGRVPASLIEGARNVGVRVRTSYGLTEMSSQVATTGDVDEHPNQTMSGTILPYREVQISDDGIIQVRGKTLFSGYVSRDGLSRPFDAAGWFITGDVGQLDPDGRLKVTGRKDTMFVSGGENIYPEEIEEAIINSGLVAQAIVVSVDDEEFGSRPVAFTSPDADVDELVAYLRSAIAGFKIPVRFLQLPAESAGLKYDRAKLRTIAAT
jgi:O-succinylbenzoic acid--CoA ligase